MFKDLSILPADPILGLNQQFHQDSNPDKINLSVGVYQNSDGNTPIFTAVKSAEKKLFELEKTKSYIAQAGDADFLSGKIDMILGTELASSMSDRVGAVMTPGGCGALRMLAELLVDSNKSKRVWVSDPTWANHFPLLQSAGLELHEYSYYDASINGVYFDAMLKSLEQIPEGDTVLLHGCCHNPTGTDITHEQWDQIIALLKTRNLLPFIDVAYQGFGLGLEEDAYGIRLAAKELPEVIISSSCSKNLGLYRERIGAALVICENQHSRDAAVSHILTAARRSYSMSPYHGGGIAGLIFKDQELNKEWKQELEEIRLRMNQLREQLANGLNDAQSKMNFDFVAQSSGMFCYLGIGKEAVRTLRSEFGIYLLDSTRINVAGLSEHNLPTIIDRVANVITR